GESTDGVMDRPGAADTVLFNATVGQFVTIQVARTGGDLKPDLWLYDPNGTVVRGASANGDREAIIAHLPVAASGLYQISVQALGATTGSYHLALTLEGASQPGAMCSGQTV